MSYYEDVKTAYNMVEIMLRSGVSHNLIKYKIEKRFGFDADKLLKKVMNRIEDIKYELPEEIEKAGFISRKSEIPEKEVEKVKMEIRDTDKKKKFEEEFKQIMCD